MLAAKWRAFKNAATPSSLAILEAQSAMDRYRLLVPWVIILVLMTSKGVVRTPVTAPASAPTTDVSPAFSSVREPRSVACTTHDISPQTRREYLYARLPRQYRAHLVGLLELLISHKLNCIEWQVPQQKRAVACKESPCAFSGGDSAHGLQRAPELACGRNSV